MSAEITFILEPDSGRITVESSQASADVVREIKRSLGPAVNLNCGRPEFSGKSVEREVLEKPLAEVESLDGSNAIYLFRLYHRSTVDGPGRRSVVQLAGCSILCPGFIYSLERAKYDIAHERHRQRTTYFRRFILV